MNHFDNAQPSSGFGFGALAEPVRKDYHPMGANPTPPLDAGFSGKTLKLAVAALAIVVGLSFLA